jgi:hypothetical protein
MDNQDDLGSQHTEGNQPDIEDQEKEFEQYYDYKLHGFRKTYCEPNPGHEWHKRVKRRERKENNKSVLSATDIADNKMKLKMQSLDLDSEGSENRDGYDYELLEDEQYGIHQNEVERQNQELAKLNTIVESKNELKESANDHEGKDKKGQ